MDTVTARKKEAIKSSEVACLLISQETIEEMQKKIENAVTEKCDILGTADGVIESIDDLVEKRQRAFLASRIAIDPTMADPANAEFENLVSGDYSGRIDSINAALDAINNNPTIANLQKLVDLSGKYTGDKILDEVKNFIAGSNSVTGGAISPEEQAQAKARVDALRYASTNVTPKGGPVDNPLPTIRPYKARNPLIGPNAPVPPMSTPLRITPATTGRTTPKLKRSLNSKLLNSLDAYNPNNKATTLPTEPEEQEEPVTLPEPESAPKGTGLCQQDFPEIYNYFRQNSDFIMDTFEKNPKELAKILNIDLTLPPSTRTITINSGGDAYNIQQAIRSCDPKNNPRDIFNLLGFFILSYYNLRKPPALPMLPEGLKKLKRQGKMKSFVTEKERKKEQKKIKELGEKLAKDQILRLKSRTSGRNVILQLAQDVTAEADKLVQLILDQRTDLQFKLSNLNNVDVKVGGAVDIYETEMAKVKTCMSTRKASAIEQYDKELEDLQKQKKDIMTTKTFEVQKQQQGQPGQQNKKIEQMTLEEANKEIGFLNKRIEDWKRNGKKEGVDPIKQTRDRIAKLRTHISNLPTTGGGSNRRHRFTVRQPKRFHGY